MSFFFSHKNDDGYALKGGFVCQNNIFVVVKITMADQYIVGSVVAA